MERLHGWLFQMLNLLKNHSYQELLKNLCQLDNLIQVVLSQNESFIIFFMKMIYTIISIQFLLEKFQKRNAKKSLLSLEGIWTLESRTIFENLKNNLSSKVGLCLVHVIWTGRRMSNLVLNVKYLLLLSFLTAAEFYNLGHIQGIIRVH